jgi:hypothetical protein
VHWRILTIESFESSFDTINIVTHQRIDALNPYCVCTVIASQCLPQVDSCSALGRYVYMEGNVFQSTLSYNSDLIQVCQRFS